MTLFVSQITAFVIRLLAGVESSVGGDMRHPQRDDRALEWNRAITTLLATLYPQKAYFVDVWNLSLTSKRKDNVHFQYDYYKTVSALFANLV